MSDIIIQESLVADFNWNCHPQSLWLAIEKLQECALLLENVRQIKHIIQWNMTNCTEKMCHWHRCKVQYCMVHGWQQWLHVFVYINIWYHLTLILLTWRIWWAPNNANKWQMGFNLAFKGLINQSAHHNPLS